VRLPEPPVLVITDRRQASRGVVEVVESALAAGCRWISLREKDLPPADQLVLAREIARLAAPYEALVTLHGDPALALETGLGGVHLPAGGDVARARVLLGPQHWVGASTHDEDGIRAAAKGGADAVTLSPIFPSCSKPGYGPALGLGRLAAAARASRLPIVALGGIDDALRAHACLDAGAAGIAVMGAIMRASDPAAAMRAFLDAVGSRGRAQLQVGRPSIG